ncbi:hypothetical protein [Paenibacillus donghaensis]
MKKLKLGYAPTRRFTFSAEDAFRYKVTIRQKMESFGLCGALMFPSLM